MRGSWDYFSQVEIRALYDVLLATYERTKSKSLVDENSTSHTMISWFINGVKGPYFVILEVQKLLLSQLIADISLYHKEITCGESFVRSESSFDDLQLEYHCMLGLLLQREEKRALENNPRVL